MLRTLGMMFAAALIATVASAPAKAEAVRISGQPISALSDGFDAGTALSDAALADVHGKGPEPRAFVKRVARDGFEDFSRQTTTLMPVTFDNWFVDNAGLIVSNILR